MLNRNKQPDIKDAVEFDLKLKPYNHFTLDNGLPVYSVDAGEQEVIMFEWVFFAGNWYEDKNIVAATVNHLLKNGTRQKTAFDINEHFEFYGSYLNRNCFNETASISLHTLSRHVPELLPVVAEIMIESVFPEEEIAIYKQNQKQRLEISLKKCDFVANRLIDEFLYGFHHPYGKYASTLDFDNLEREELLQFYNRYYSAGKCMLFVAGKLPPDIQEQLNKNFGYLPFNLQPLPHRHYLPQPAQDKKYNLVNDTSGVQAAIRVAKPLFNRHHPDFLKMRVLNNILGGYFGSRLMSNIREEKGYTYGIHSYLQNYVHESALMISTEAGRKVSAATVEEIYKEMKKLREVPLDEEELYLVKNHMMGSLLGDLDGPFQIISRWKNYILNNLTEDYFYKSIDTVKTITSEDLMELANKYLKAEDFYELVVI